MDTDNTVVKARVGGLGGGGKGGRKWRTSVIVTIIFFKVQTLYDSEGMKDEDTVRGERKNLGLC